MSQRPSERTALLLLPALAALAVGLLLARRWLPELPLLEHPLLPWWCAFVLTYVGAASISLLPAPLGKAVDSALDRHLSQWGAGVYGLIALSVFLPLELRSLVESLREFDSAGGDWLRDLLRDWLIGFSAESLRNMISAAIWPARAIQEAGVWGFLGFLGACSAVFELGRRLMPEQQARLDDGDAQASSARGSKTADADMKGRTTTRAD